MNAKVPDGWRHSRLGLHLREPIRNGYSPVCPKEPTGKWMAHLGAVTEHGFNPAAVKPAPLNDSRVDAAGLEPGDLVVSRSNTRERVGLAGIYEGAPMPCSYPDLLMRVRTTPDLEQRFLLFTLLSRTGRRYFHSAARGTSGSMVKIDRSLLENFPLVLPPVAEQRDIAATLNAVRGAIAAGETVVEQLDIVRHVLLARLMERGLADSVDVTSTPTGPAPSHWDQVTISELATEISYGTSLPLNSDGHGVPVLRIPNVVTGAVDTDLKFAELSSSDLAGLRLFPDDLLIVRTNGNPGYVGKTLLFPKREGDWAFASYLIRVRVARQRVLPAFLHYALQYRGVRRSIERGIRTSAGNYNLNTQGIRTTALNLPPIQEQQAIVEVLDALRDRLQRERAAVEARRAVAEALASGLLTGAVRVAQPAPEART